MFDVGRSRSSQKLPQLGRKDTRDVLDALDQDWDEKDSEYDNV